jgi:hypothetical protein
LLSLGDIAGIVPSFRGWAFFLAKVVRHFRKCEPYPSDYVIDEEGMDTVLLRSMTFGPGSPLVSEQRGARIELARMDQPKTQIFTDLSEAPPLRRRANSVGFEKKNDEFLSLLPLGEALVIRDINPFAFDRLNGQRRDGRKSKERKSAGTGKKKTCNVC